MARSFSVRADGGRRLNQEDASLSLVLVAAGRGTRLGGENKVWRLIESHPLWWWAASRFSGLVQAGVVVVGREWVSEAHRAASSLPFATRVLAGGEERWESSAIGIRAVTTTYVAVHDAARPLVSPSLIARVLRAARETGAALPGLPVSDTVKLVEHGQVKMTLPRESVMLAQTPQIFRTDWALSALNEPAGPVTDDVSWLEKAGRPVALVAGDLVNRKVTTSEDWDWLLQHWGEHA